MEKVYYIKFKDIKATVKGPDAAELSLEQFLDCLEESDRAYNTFEDYMVKDDFIMQVTEDYRLEEDGEKKRRLRKLKRELINSDVKSGPFYAYLYIDNDVADFVLHLFLASKICEIMLQF